MNRWDALGLDVYVVYWLEKKGVSGHMALLVTDVDKEGNERKRRYYSFWPINDAYAFGEAALRQSVEGTTHQSVADDSSSEEGPATYLHIQGLDEDELVQSMDDFLASKPRFGLPAFVCTDVTRRGLTVGGLEGLRSDLASGRDEAVLMHRKVTSTLNEIIGALAKQPDLATDTKPPAYGKRRSELPRKSVSTEEKKRREEVQGVAGRRIRRI